MKKIKLFSCLAIALAFASCKKESQEPLMQQSVQKSMQQQVADLIQEGDPDMFNVIYGNTKAMKPSVHTHPGVFHWPATGNPEDGNCVSWPDCVCMVCIEGARFVNENTPEFEINRDFHKTWISPGDAELLINDGSATTIQNLKSLDITFDRDGNSIFSYSTL